MKNILIVEDESIVAMEISSYIKKQGYNVTAICSSADDAYDKAINNDIDLVLMDINLKKSSGIDAAKRIKNIKEIPIIFLTAYMDEITIDKAISVNPIAYLIKPFNRHELFASMKIAFKNSDKNKISNIVGDIIFDNEFSFNTASSELICYGEVVTLTKKERDLLKLFIYNKNQLLTISTIESQIWPNKVSNDNTRRALVSRLRAKINHKFINTVASEGYIFKLN